MPNAERITLNAKRGIKSIKRYALSILRETGGNYET
jgi:hypothetical protein